MTIKWTNYSSHLQKSLTDICMKELVISHIFYTLVM